MKQIKMILQFHLLRKGIIALALCSSLSVFSQTRNVKGQVVDQNGEPIIGASAVVKGTKLGVVTDLDGNFSLQNAPEQGIIEISYMGYKTLHLKVGKSGILKAVMEENAQSLSDVVVVGYGTVKKSNVVGSIAKIGAETFEDRPVGRIEQALQGQMAGVSVRSTSGSPGSDITINIRGAASISGITTPLYVVDGVPIDNLSGINPGDIESIDVLKDAASAAIYGSRGSNGVVLVTTKKGKTGKPTITLNAYAAVSQLERKVDVMNSDEWISFNKKWLDRQWVNATGQDASVSQAERIAYAEKKDGRTYQTRDDLYKIRSTYGIYDPWWGTDELEAIDWQDEFFRSAPAYDVQLNATGATERINYSVSGGVYRQEGIVYGSSYNRYTLRANLEAKITDYFKINLQLAPTFVTIQR